MERDKKERVKGGVEDWESVVTGGVVLRVEGLREDKVWGRGHGGGGG